MRIKFIRIQNFLSYDAFEWRDLDPHLNLVVGPNGVGKTNLLHALRVVRDVVSYDRHQDVQVWARSAHRGVFSQPIKITLGLQFTGEWEQRLLSTFLVASMCDAEAIQSLSGYAPMQSGVDPEAIPKFSDKVCEQLRSADISWLLSGQLVVTFDGIRWYSWYEPLPSSTPFYLSLDSPKGSSALYGAREAKDTARNSLFAAWAESFNTLLPPGEVPGTRAVRLQGDSTWVIDEEIEIGKFFAGRADLAESHAPNLSDVPNMVSARTPVGLQVKRAQVPLSTHRAFEEATGVTLDEGRFYNARWVFQLLLDRGMLFTDNARRLPRYRLSLSEYNAHNVDLSNGEQLPLFLFDKKNGSASEHKLYDDVQHLFKSLTGNQFDVGRADPPVMSDSHQVYSVTSVPDDGRIALSINISSRWGDIPLDYSGAGIREALFLSALIAQRASKVVLLDEPASNLHPTMQTTLLREIEAHPDNQFLVVTHSPALITPDAVSKVSRFSMRHGHTVRSALDLGTLSREEREKLEKVIRGSMDLRAALFGRGVIVVEGDSEIAALPVWFRKAEDVWGSDDITLYTVNGDQQFAAAMSILRQFDIPWVIVCDGKVIGDQPPPMRNIAKQLEAAGMSGIPSLDGLDFAERRRLLAQVGVLTLADTVNDELENLLVMQAHREAAREAGRSKANQAHYIAAITDCPDEVAALLRRAKESLEKSGA